MRDGIDRLPTNPLQECEHGDLEGAGGRQAASQEEPDPGKHGQPASCSKNEIPLNQLASNEGKVISSILP
jgi:hypothetical protein